MHRVYDGYERRKTAMGRLDFEDMLGLALRLFDEHPDAVQQVRARFAAFTVDEFSHRVDRGPAGRGIHDGGRGPRYEFLVLDRPGVGTFSGEQTDERFRPSLDDDSSTRSRVALNSH